jgi:hypothetical protein
MPIDVARVSVILPASQTPENGATPRTVTAWMRRVAILKDLRALPEC